MLVKEISSFEVLFPHGRERQGTLPKTKSSAIRGILNGFGFLDRVIV